MVWQKIRNKHSIFPTKDSKKTAKRIVIDQLQHIKLGKRWDSPLAILLGPECFATETKRAVFDPPASTLHDWCDRMWQFSALSSSVEGGDKFADHMYELYKLAGEEELRRDIRIKESARQGDVSVDPMTTPNKEESAPKELAKEFSADSSARQADAGSTIALKDENPSQANRAKSVFESNAVASPTTRATMDQGDGKQAKDAATGRTENLTLVEHQSSNVNDELLGSMPMSPKESSSNYKFQVLPSPLTVASPRSEDDMSFHDDPWLTQKDAEQSSHQGPPNSSDMSGNAPGEALNEPKNSICNDPGDADSESSSVCSQSPISQQLGNTSAPRILPDADTTDYAETRTNDDVTASEEDGGTGKKSVAHRSATSLASSLPEKADQAGQPRTPMKEKKVKASQPRSKRRIDNEESVLVSATGLGSENDEESDPTSLKNVVSATKKAMEEASLSPSDSLSRSSVEKEETETRSLYPFRSCSKKTRKSMATEHSQFSDIKGLLVRGGYHFGQELFCRPGGNPAQNKDARLGRDFFDTLASFRSSLCRFGVNDPGHWSFDEKKKIHEWVRMEVIRSVDQREELPDHELLNDNKAWDLMQELGFQWKPFKSCGEFGFFPGVEIGIEGHDMFHEQKDLLKRLGRFGLPDTCNFANIDLTALLSLEVYLTQVVSLEETFTLFDEDSGSHRSARKRASRHQSSPSLNSTPSSSSSSESEKGSPHGNAAGKIKLSDVNYTGEGWLKVALYTPENVKFSQVKDLLKSGGFEFTKDWFCRPGGNPKNNKGAIKGRDYFDTESKLRTHLCQYGVNGCDSWTHQDKKMINTWVRRSIVHSKEKKIAPVPRTRSWPCLRLV